MPSSNLREQAVARNRGGNEIRVRPAVNLRVRDETEIRIPPPLHGKRAGHRANVSADDEIAGGARRRCGRGIRAGRIVARHKGREVARARGERRHAVSSFNAARRGSDNKTEQRIALVAGEWGVHGHRTMRAACGQKPNVTIHEVAASGLFHQVFAIDVRPEIEPNARLRKGRARIRARRGPLPQRPSAKRRVEQELEVWWRKK